MVQYPGRKVVALLAHDFLTCRNEFFYMCWIPIVVLVPVHGLPGLQELRVVGAGGQGIGAALNHVAR